MIRRLLLVSLALVVVLLGVASPIGSVRSAAAGGEEAEADPALDRLASCVARTERLAVVVLLDESGSLTDTDPFDQRVGAIKAATQGLQALADLSVEGQELQVSVLFAGFANDYQAYTDWMVLGEVDPQTLVAKADAFAPRDTESNTDFYAALSGAQQELARRAATSDSDDICRAVIMATDGDFYVPSKDGRPYLSGSDAEGDALIDDAKEAVCRPGGLMDRLRSDEVALFAVALESDQPGLGVTDPDFLRSLAEGRSGSVSCGDPSNAFGAYLPADDIADLPRLVLEILLGQPAGGERDVALEACTDGAPPTVYPFEVNAALSRFLLFVDTSAPGVQVALQAPSGAVTPRAALGSRTSSTLDGAVIEQVPFSDSAALIDVALDPTSASWAGEWLLGACSSADQGEVALDVDLRVFGGLVPVLDVDPAGYRVGEAHRIPLTVQTESGAPLPPPELVEIDDLTVTSRDPLTGDIEELTVEEIERGRYEVVLEPPEDTEAGYLDLETVLVPTVPGGSQLPAARTSTEVRLLPPAAYPPIEDLVLRLPEVEETGSTSGVLRVRGSEIGDGQVCIRGSEEQRSPVTADAIAYTGTLGCVDVPRGAEVEVPVSYRVEEAGSGRFVAQLLVELGADNVDGLRPQRVEARFELLRAPETAPQVFLFVVFMTLGVAGPIAALTAYDRVTTRFPNRQTLRAAAVPVTVAATGTVGLGGDGSPVQLTVDDFAYLGGGGGDRSFDLVRESGVAALAACTVSARPRFSAPPVATMHVPGMAGVGALGTRGRGSGAAAVVPMELRGAWAVFGSSIDGVGESAVVHGVLVAFTHADLDLGPQVDDLLGELRSNGAEVARALLGAMPVVAAADDGPATGAGRDIEGTSLDGGGPVGGASAEGPAGTGPDDDGPMDLTL